VNQYRPGLHRQNTAKYILSWLVPCLRLHHQEFVH